MQCTYEAAIVFAAMPTLLALASSSSTGDPFAAVGWVERLLVGPLGAGIAVIAVAWFGLSLLGGRLSMRRGGLVVLGCFVLFGAPSLARGLLGLAGDASGARAVSPAAIIVPPSMAKPAQAYDPYAGASVPSAQ